MVKHLLQLLVGVTVGLAGTAGADTWYQDTVTHQGQPTNYLCGETVIAMWASSISGSYDAWDAYDAIEDRWGSGEGSDGTDTDELAYGIFDLTPYGWYFSNWTYSDKEATIKGMAWSIAKYTESVAASGIYGAHWFLVRGVKASSNPYTYYGSASISYVYVNDSKYDSPVYTSSYFSPTSSYSPSSLMSKVNKIGSWWPYDKKYRTVERTSSYSLQGETQSNTDSYSSY